MKCPAELYSASPRRYDGLPELTYPFHDRDILVTACSRNRFIVHGHSPLRSGQLDVRPNSMSLDTAAVYGGPLSAAVFVDGSEGPTEFIQTTAVRQV